MERTRRIVTLMVIPLAVMALGMFAAVLVPYGYPLAWVTVTVPVSEPSLFLLVHVVAGILAVWIAFAARRDAAPGLAPALVALLGILGMTALSALAVKTFSDSGLWTPVLVFVAPVVFALVLALNAMRMRGWDRMLFLLGALAISALPYGCPLIPGTFAELSSGLVFIAADVTVLALFARGLRQG